MQKLQAIGVFLYLFQLNIAYSCVAGTDCIHFYPGESIDYLKNKIDFYENNFPIEQNNTQNLIILGDNGFQYFSSENIYNDAIKKHEGLKEINKLVEQCLSIQGKKKHRTLLITKPLPIQEMTFFLQEGLDKPYEKNRVAVIKLQIKFKILQIVSEIGFLFKNTNQYIKLRNKVNLENDVTSCLSGISTGYMQYSPFTTRMLEYQNNELNNITQNLYKTAYQNGLITDLKMGFKIPYSIIISHADNSGFTDFIYGSDQAINSKTTYQLAIDYFGSLDNWHDSFTKFITLGK